MNHLHKHLHEVYHGSLKRFSSLASVVAEESCVWKMYVMHAFTQMDMPSIVSFCFHSESVKWLMIYRENVAAECSRTLLFNVSLKVETTVCFFVFFPPQTDGLYICSKKAIIQGQVYPCAVVGNPC